MLDWVCSLIAAFLLGFALAMKIANVKLDALEEEINATLRRSLRQQEIDRIDASLRHSDNVARFEKKVH